MNIGKGVNLVKFVKILAGIFAGVRGFWISLGSIFIALIILLMVFVYPLSNRYVRVYKGLDDLSVVLEKYALKKDLYNEKWIASKELEAELCDKEIEKCKSFLKSRDERLEAVFSREDQEKGLVKVDDEALWKNEYSRRVSALFAKLKDGNVSLNKDALPFADWGSAIPTWDAILPVQKRFWILEAIMQIALNNTGIAAIEKVTFRDSSYTYNPSFAQIYTAIPLTMQVELRADCINFLLQEVLKSDIPFVIEGIAIINTDKIFSSDQSTKNEGALVKETDTNNRLTSPIINVTLDMYVIDYKA